MRTTSQRPEILVLATPPIHPTVAEGLARAARRIEVVGDAQALLLQAWKRVPDLVLIEAAAQGPDPSELCRQLRRYFPCAIMIVEEGASERDRIGWLESGADDVLSSGAAGEIGSRCGALVRRLQRQRRADPGAFQLHALGMQLAVAERRLVLPDGRPVDLSATLTRLLAILFSQGDGVVPAAVLSQQLFVAASINRERRLNTLTRELSRRLGQLPPPRPQIECVRGAGYRLTLVENLEGGAWIPEAMAEQ